MEVIRNERLSSHTTVHLGGTAEEYLIPESTGELLQLVRERNPRYFIGGGSNLLIADHSFDLVVDLSRFNTDIQIMEDGKFLVGASVRLQKLINTINENGFGGIEYLYSVPGLVGGAVVMNAGRGKNYHQSISDYICSANVIRNGQMETLSKEQCQFVYRGSIFKNSPVLIDSVLFTFPEMTQEETSRLKQERMALCREKQDMSAPNFGSVFSEWNGKVMKYVCDHKTGGKVHFSGKTMNWLLNEGGNYEEAVSAIRKAEFYHKIALKKCEREVMIWE